MKSRKLPLCLAIAAAISGIYYLVVVPLWEPVYWVGVGDLKVTFHVTDVGGLNSVPFACIDIEVREWGFCDEEDEKDREIHLTTAEDGTTTLTRRCMCFGTVAWLRGIDTFGSHLPNWKYRVTAAGFETSEWIELKEPETYRSIKRQREGAYLAVVVELRNALDP